MRAAVAAMFAAGALTPAVAALAALAQGNGYQPNTYTYRTLNNPTGGDEFMIRGAIQQDAQHLTDKLFGALASVLGGTAPRLNFVVSGSPLVGTADTSANVSDQPGAPAGTINADPLAVEGLTNFFSAFHNAAVSNFPHEMAHLRQTLSVLADMAQREGGAQAFTDLVTPVAAQRANIPFTAGNYDGSYAPFVQQVQARPDARSWILGGQFGNAAPPTWP